MNTAVACCPARPARPACCHSEAQVPGDQHRVKTGDVDAKLKCGRGGHAGDPPVAQSGLKAAAVVWQVAGAVGGDAARQFLVESIARGERDGLRAAPRTDEGKRRNLGLDQRGEQVRGLRGGRPARPHLGVRVQQPRLPQGEGDRRPRRAVVGDGERVKAGE
jgi:hypothetical protein